MARGGGQGGGAARLSVQRDVARDAGEWVRLLTAVVANNPGADPYDLLARPDVTSELARHLGDARARVQRELDQAWPPGAPSAYRASLEADVARAYAEAAAGLRQAAVTAYQSVPAAVFVPGVTRPGDNPAMAAARRRVAAVTAATSREAWHLGLRNELTVGVAKVRHAGEEALAGAPAWAMKEWVTRRDAKVCDWCRALARAGPVPVWQEFSHGGPVGGHRPPRVYLDLMCPPRHPRCLPGDSLVAAESVSGATSRVFHGEMVGIRTLSDKFLRATPNHPVLTDHGWVPIGLLKEGDYVVSARGDQWKRFGDYHDQGMPATIQQVAESFLRSEHVTATEVPTSPEDFHGDGAGSEVSIVGTNGGLLRERHGALVQVVGQQKFERTDVPGTLLASSCYRALLFPREGHTTDSGVCGGSLSLSLHGGHGSHAQESSFVSPSWLDACVQQVPAYDVSGDTQGLRESILRLPGGVALDQVVEIQRNVVTTHVYNIETRDGWYIGNGIVVHNCRCKLRITTGKRVLVAVHQQRTMFVSARHVRAMSAGRYEALHSFHVAALHQLGPAARAQREAR